MVFGVKIHVLFDRLDDEFVVPENGCSGVTVCFRKCFGDVTDQ